MRLRLRMALSRWLLKLIEPALAEQISRRAGPLVRALELRYRLTELTFVLRDRNRRA